jgi:hypothetical protein
MEVFEEVYVFKFFPGYILAILFLTSHPKVCRESASFFVIVLVITGEACAHDGVPVKFIFINIMKVFRRYLSCCGSYIFITKLRDLQV